MVRDICPLGWLLGPLVKFPPDVFTVWSFDSDVTTLGNCFPPGMVFLLSIELYLWSLGIESMRVGVKNSIF